MGFELEVDSEYRVNRERIAGGVKDILGDFVTMSSSVLDANTLPLI